MHKIIPLFLLCWAASLTTGFSQDLTQKSGFSVAPQEEHYFLFVLANRPNDLPEMRTEITKYIWKYFPNAHLKVTQIKVEGELENVPLILLQAFSNKTQAMEFYGSLKKNRPDFMQMGLTLDYFALTKGNYEQIVRSKSLNGYKSFFDQHYVSNR